MSRRETITEALTLNGTRITEIKDTLDGNSSTSILTENAVAEAIAAIVVTGSNPGEIYNVRSYGAVPNVSVPASGVTVSGTNQATAFNSCIAAAPDNATVFVGSGNWLVSTPLTAITSKRLNLIILGNIYTNGANFLTFNAPGGADRHHTVYILGTIIGRVNDPSHTKTNYDASASPLFSTFTGAGITLNSGVNALHCYINRIEGFQAGIDIVVGGGNGCQENVFAFQKLHSNRYGIRLRSTDGVSWCDKNKFLGFHGGMPRVSGEVAIKIDGFSGAASTNGEIYNGAFRSNKFELMIEAVTRIMEVNGDVTEPRFDITIEAGTNTGVFDPTNAIQARSVSPNFVRSPKWCGQGILDTRWMSSPMGIDGTIDMPVWLNASSYIGNKGIVDSSGNIIMDVRKSLSSSTRASALAANVKTANLSTEIRNEVTTTAASYTVQADDYCIICNTAAGCTVNLPSPSTSIGREIMIRGINATGGVSISGGDPDGANTLTAGQGGLLYYNPAGTWRIKNKWHD